MIVSCPTCRLSGRAVSTVGIHLTLCAACIPFRRLLNGDDWIALTHRGNAYV